jgi:hypothetical protein
MGCRAQNSGMKESGQIKDKDAPGVDRGPSWADETLPLGLRKELLARQLQKVGARKTDAGPRSASSGPDLTGRKVERQTPERSR